MNRDTLISTLANRLGNRTDLTTKMQTELVFLQEIVLEENMWLPWFLESTVQDLATTASNALVLFPTGFLSEMEESALEIQDTESSTGWRGLTKMDYDDAQQRAESSGVPKYYSLSSTGFLLSPTPDAIYQLRCRCYVADDALTTNIENKWLRYAADVVFAELGNIMAGKHMQHAKLAQEFRNDAVAAWTRLHNKHIARQEANRERAMDA